MTKTKSTKRALLMSALALLMCVSMLIGSTFAWFTDSVTSGSNVIQSGTLDIVMEYWNGDSWENAEGQVLEFKKASTSGGSEVLWEPGCTYELPKIRVRNEGNLAAYVVLRVNGITGDEKLMEAITFQTKVTNIPESILNGSQASFYEKFDDAPLNWFYGTNDGTVMFDWTVAPKGETIPNFGHTDTTAEFTVVGHMAEEAGNEYQGLKIEGVSITALATQAVYEYDSFGRKYDDAATLPNIVNVSTADEMATALTSTEETISVNLLNDVDVSMKSLGSQTSGSGEYKLGGEDTKQIVINLNGNDLTLTTTYMTAIGAKNPDATITIKNGSMNSTGNKATTWNINDLTFANCNYVFENVVFDKEVALVNTGKNVTMKNVTINGTGNYYALWISARGQNVEIDNLTVNTPGRAIKIDEQYVDAPEKVTLNVSNSKFVSAEKSAIMVKTAAGADINLKNVDITNVAADTTNAVWNDADAKDYYDLVTVTGGTKVQEQ